MDDNVHTPFYVNINEEKDSSTVTVENLLGLYSDDIKTNIIDIDNNVLESDLGSNILEYSAYLSCSVVSFNVKHKTLTIQIVDD